jgi:ribosomal protein S18 acetylase RimI-like enzyme
MPPDDKTMNDRATGARAPWRAMAEDDLQAVHALSTRVHPNHPERAEVLAEKFRLYPRGCFVLTPGQGIRGYCFSHPWMRGMVPALDAFLGKLPETPTTYYVHDLTIGEAVRRQGQGRAVVPLLLETARSAGLSHLSLVAVNHRGPFWQAAGFVRSADEALQAAARAKYDTGAEHMERQL